MEVVIKVKSRNYFDVEEFQNVNEVDVGEGANDDISVVRVDVEPMLVDIDVVECNEDNLQDEVTDEDDEEEEFSNRESSIGSLDRDLEEVELESDSSDDN